MRHVFLSATLLVVVSTVSVSSAFAQVPGGGIALDQYDPAPAGDGFFAVQTPWVAKEDFVPNIRIVGEYARNPLVLKNNLTSVGVVTNQAFVHVGLSFALWNRLLVGANLPLAVYQSGESGEVAGVHYDPPTMDPKYPIDVGNLRIDARIRVFGEDKEFFQLALGGSVYAPSSRSGTYAGEHALRVAPTVVVGGHRRSFVWSATLQLVVRESTYPATLNYGVAMGYASARMHNVFSLEFFGASPLEEGYLFTLNGRLVPRGWMSNLEVHASVRQCIAARSSVGLAGGPALSDAMGTPLFRLVGMVGWAESCR